MKRGLENLFKSIFGSRTADNRQSANIHGDYNTVNQTFIINSGSSLEKHDLLAGEQPSLPDAQSTYLTVEDFDDDDSDEIRKILEYRKIADSGQGQIGLQLLESLKLEPPFASGYFAFRLHFNIGIILQNIGQEEPASAALRTAFNHYPDNNKAKTAKALADLLDGQNEVAFNDTFQLSQIKGDHSLLAKSIMFQAAKRLGKKIENPEPASEFEEETNVSVVAARLDYLRIVSPEDYHDALKQARRSFPKEDTIRIMWALDELNDMKRNLAFLLGAKMPPAFEQRVSECSEIFHNDVKIALNRQPPNMLTLPSQANNAAVALRLSGDVVVASRLIESVIETFPELEDELVQIRASLLLQQDRDDEALALIQHSTQFPELQIMASELEATRGQKDSAIERINKLLDAGPEDELRKKVLLSKAQIGIKLSDRGAADEALEDLQIYAAEAPELVHLRSAYDREFGIETTDNNEEELLVSEEDRQSDHDKNLLASLRNSKEWDFATLLQVSDELFARGYYRDCASLLADRVSFSKESPALSRLCDACIHGSLGTLAKQISEQFTLQVKNSVFGMKFDVNVAYLSGEIAKSIPLTRKLFEQNPQSIGALERYVQSLLRTNDLNRIKRVVKKLSDHDMQGSLDEQRSYVNLLVHCGEIERARIFAYKLYCNNQNDHRSWLALSSGVLAFGQKKKGADNLSQISSIQPECTMEVQKPDGTKQIYTIEADERLMRLRLSNISPDHPIAQAANGKSRGETFEWPIGKMPGEATVLSVKHKALAAFHGCLERFEEQFPNVSGFKSVSIDFEDEDGLSEMKAIMRRQSDYAQQKAKEYNESHYPIHILAHHLGIDPIDAFLGLKNDCGYSLKVTLCTIENQEKASAVLKDAKSKGIICDATVCYLIRRLQIDDLVKEEFGTIGVTQATLDIFASRLNDFESSIFYDSDTGEKKVGRLSMRNENMVMSGQSGNEIELKLDTMRSDLDWLETECELIPAVAKVDPPDEIIQFRQDEGGRFFDELFAANGSERILISEDYHLRQWAESQFSVRSAWLQALIHHLETEEKISPEKVVTSTLELIRIGEHALTTNSGRLLRAVKMWASNELTEEEFSKFCSMLGQEGADLITHWDVGLTTIRGLWHYREFIKVRRKATSILLRSLSRMHTERVPEILDSLEAHVRDAGLREYINKWRIGHFLTRN